MDSIYIIAAVVAVVGALFTYALIRGRAVTDTEREKQDMEQSDWRGAIKAQAEGYANEASRRFLQNPPWEQPHIFPRDAQLASDHVRDQMKPGAVPTPMRFEQPNPLVAPRDPDAQRDDMQDRAMRAPDWY